MIEEVVISHLSQSLSVPVWPEYPPDPPKSFVVLHKGDGSRKNYLEEALVVADAYGGSLLEVGRLNEQVLAAMDGLLAHPAICGLRQVSNYPAYDTKNKRHRYQAVFTIYF